MLISSSVPCIWKLLGEKWRLPALTGNIFQPVEVFFWELAHIQAHSGLIAVSQAFKRIWYSSTIVSVLKTLFVFFCFCSSREKGYLMSLLLGEKREVLKNDDGPAREGWCSYFGLVSQTITNFGSDDILILSPWVCETTPSVCFPLIRVIATNIIATVPHDKLLHANVWGWRAVWWAEVSNCTDVTEQQCCILITIRRPLAYLIWLCSHVVNQCIRFLIFLLHL